MKNSSKSSNLKLKNHITQKSGRIARAIESRFDINMQDFADAVSGDESKIRRIGELSRQGRLASEIAPQIAKAYNEIIDGTTAYNKAMSEVLINAGKSAIEVDKAAMGSALGNKQYMNKKREMAMDYVNATRSEESRHEYQMNYGQIRGYIDAYITSVDNRSSLIDQSNRPELKQVSADEAHKTKVVNELLAKGDKARVDLMPPKDYQHRGFRESVTSRFASIKSALGI
jgi:hypothetical protein